jgi:hypothetical protein
MPKLKLKKKNYTSYKPYIHRLLQNRHEGMRVAPEATTLLDNLANFSTHTLMEGGANLLRDCSAGTLTLQPRDIACFVEATCTPELAHSINSLSRRSIRLFKMNTAKHRPSKDEGEEGEEEEEEEPEDADELLESISAS